MGESHGSFCVGSGSHREPTIWLMYSLEDSALGQPPVRHFKMQFSQGRKLAVHSYAGLRNKAMRERPASENNLRDCLSQDACL